MKWDTKKIATDCVAVDGKRTEYTFEGIRSLVLDCLGSGDRVWKARYVVYEGTERVYRRKILGRLDPEALRGMKAEDRDKSDLLSPGQARDAADAIVSQAKTGHDPWLAEHHQKKGKPSSGITLADAYERWRDDPGRQRVLAPRTREGYDRIFALYVPKKLAETSVENITKPMVISLLEDVRVSTTDPKKGKRGLQATKLLAILKPVFAWLEGSDVIQQNVVRTIPVPVPKENPKGKVNLPISDAELRLVWNAFSEHAPIMTVRLFKLSILLGKRVSEFVGALKTEVDLAGGFWFIPADREGNKSKVPYFIAIPPLARSILTDAINDAGDSKYVFPKAPGADEHVSRNVPSQAWLALRRELNVAATARFHDSRTFLNDLMTKLGVPREFRSHVMQHTSDMNATLASSTYSTYEYEKEKRLALELCETRIMEIVDGRPFSEINWNSPKRMLVGLSVNSH